MMAIEAQVRWEDDGLKMMSWVRRGRKDDGEKGAVMMKVAEL